VKFSVQFTRRAQSDIVSLHEYIIVYRVKVSKVEVLAVFDGRRDARALLDERLLRN
jgi:hypothetical protein